ncbi:MAG TPA: hypothetical protein VL523_09260 [Terriglobia bacterium]|nr:hypothetical protein [Terriglobia bacterium]
MVKRQVPKYAAGGGDPAGGSRSRGRLGPSAIVRRRRAAALALLMACALAPAGLCARVGRQAAPNQAVEPASPPAAGTIPKLIYTRTLAGSIPEYIAVTVNKDGSGTYEGRRLSDPPHPRPLQLSSASTAQLFELAADLSYFRSLRLDSHRAKVANLGRKTFVYENGAEKNEVEFNYTQQKQALELMGEFDRIALAEQHVDLLEYGLRYDPLGLPEELLRIQADLGDKALADPELLVPSLEQIVNNPRLLHLAQVRAQEILNTVRDGR